MKPKALLTIGFILASTQLLALPQWVDTVGDQSSFIPSNRLDIRDFCSGTPREDATNCARQWLQTARENGKHLYVSAGTYVLSRSLELHSHMSVFCSSPTQAVFRKSQGTSYPVFVKAKQLDGPIEQVTIENCGFDMNGDKKNFASVIRMKHAEHITIRDNQFFDSTNRKSHERSQQRQYIVVLRAKDILIEGNRLSHGGRIKVGRPGSRILIRNNHLDFVNDNGITVVSRSGATSDIRDNITEDLIIDGNVINDATVTRIFFGADGGANGEGLKLRRITIMNNRITGKTSSTCIKGTLPATSEEIYIRNNYCVLDKAIFPWRDRYYVSGIKLTAAADSTTQSTPKAITVQKNMISSTSPNVYNLAAIFMARVNACLLYNRVEKSNIALFLKDDTQLRVKNNDWGITGTIRNDSDNEILAPQNTCYRPHWL
ncbi:MAG: hypothetical protein HRU19_27185 [Pseudobacteriovorax sp.]|nr:hypothetical protein [Pseudobacteriovorax sp.]